jgi:hypothetical protein
MSDLNQDANQISRQTTPTWEMELLISGATVFGLMQLPEPLSRMMMVLINSNESDIAALFGVMSVYVQIGLVTLIITFVLHLLARGYWVALVGMNSVYPDGVQWQRMKSLGPVYRAVIEKEVGSIKQAIERADNRATLIFSLGFGGAVAMVVPVILVGFMLAVLVIAQATNFDLQEGNKNLWLIFMLMITPWFAAYVIDYVAGKTLLLKNKAGWLKSIFSFYQKFGFSQANNTVINIFTSNSSMKKNTFLFFVAIALAIFVSTALLNKTGASSNTGAYYGLPKLEVGGEYILRPQHYASMRNQDMVSNLSAYIDDPIASKPYLKVFIPYEPRQHNALIKEICPETLNEKNMSAGSSLQCLQQFHALSIDGKPVSANFIAAEDPKTLQRGMMAMIDVRQLDVGQHLLSIKDVPMAVEMDKQPVKKAASKEVVQKIPFWK